MILLNVNAIFKTDVCFEFLGWKWIALHIVTIRILKWLLLKR